MPNSKSPRQEHQQDKGKIKELMPEIEKLREKSYSLPSIHSLLKHEGRIECGWSNFRTYYYRFRKATASEQGSTVVSPTLDEHQHESLTDEEAQGDSTQVDMAPRDSSSLPVPDTSPGIAEDSIIGGFDFEKEQAVARKIFERNRQ